MLGDGRERIPSYSTAITKNRSLAANMAMMGHPADQFQVGWTHYCPATYDPTFELHLCGPAKTFTLL